MSAAALSLPACVAVLPLVWGTADATSTRAERPPRGLRLVKPQATHVMRCSARTIPAPQLAFYRKYTEAMLQRYMKLSMEAGRVSSLMGRELFPAAVSHRAVQGFDDVVIFVHDVGRCIHRLRPGGQVLIRHIALQGYTQSEAAAMLGIAHRTVTRHYAEALDELTQLLLEARILTPAGEPEMRPVENDPGPIRVKGCGLGLVPYPDENKGYTGRK